MHRGRPPLGAADTGESQGGMHDAGRKGAAAQVCLTTDDSRQRHGRQARGHKQRALGAGQGIEWQPKTQTTHHQPQDNPCRLSHAPMLVDASQVPSQISSPESCVLLARLGVTVHPEPALDAVGDSPHRR